MWAALTASPWALRFSPMLKGGVSSLQQHHFCAQSLGEGRGVRREVISGGMWLSTGACFSVTALR